MELKIISAVSLNGIIGDRSSNAIPWAGRYPEDMAHFKKMTTKGQVIMGRGTFESLGSKPLPNRSNIVITQQEKLPGAYCYSSLEQYIRSFSCVLEDVIVEKWIIGGERLYREALQLPELKEIYLTIIPEIINGDNLASFPWIDPTKFYIAEMNVIEGSELIVATYRKFL